MTHKGIQHGTYCLYRREWFVPPAWLVKGENIPWSLYLWLSRRPLRVHTHPTTHVVPGPVALPHPTYGRASGTIGHRC
eukprot:scaffold49569_cov69-Phaeocystis_antarctica.AAC.5